jgi:hypothetical protein
MFSIIFDDDGAGEIADIVGIIEAHEKVVIEFYHCKFSGADNPGARVGDLYELCGQTEKSVHWCQDPESIIDRMIKREMDYRHNTGETRFQIGNLRKLKEIKNKMRVYKSIFHITAVQPGIDSAMINEPIKRLLSGTAAYLMDTYGIDFKLICS